MKGDRIKDSVRKAVAKTGERIGDAIGDDDLEGRGAMDHALDSVQDGYGRVRDKVRDLIDDAPGAAREVVHTGRDYYRRSAAAVTRSAADNNGLTILVAGVAIAAVSWLVFGRGRGKPEG